MFVDDGTVVFDAETSQDKLDIFCRVGCCRLEAQLLDSLHEDHGGGQTMALKNDSNENTVTCLVGATEIKSVLVDRRGWGGERVFISISLNNNNGP